MNIIGTKCRTMAMVAFLFLPLFLFSQQPNGFKIIASVTGVPDSSLVYLKMGSRVADSTFILDGAFTFKGAVDLPQVVQIIIPNTGDYRALWLENTTISIEAETGLFQYAAIRGSNLQLEQDELDAALTKYMDRADSIAYLLRDQSLGPEKRTEIYQASKAFRSKMWKVHEQFIRKHPSSWVSVLNLLLVSWRMGGEKTAEVLELLDSNLQNSKYGKEIREFISFNVNPQIGEQYVDFVQQDTTGDSIRISEILGKATLLEFWASWCGTCRAGIPRLISLYERFHEQGLEIVGIGLEKNKNKWLAAIEEDGLPWINLSDLKYGDNQAALIYSVGSIPDNVLIDSTGVIIGRNLTTTELDKILSELLN